MKSWNRGWELRGTVTGNHGREGLGLENRTWDSRLRNLRNASPQQSKAGLGNLPKPHFSSQSWWWGAVVPEWLSRYWAPLRSAGEEVSGRTAFSAWEGKENPFCSQLLSFYIYYFYSQVGFDTFKEPATAVPLKTVTSALELWLNLFFFFFHEGSASTGLNCENMLAVLF